MGRNGERPPPRDAEGDPPERLPDRLATDLNDTAAPSQGANPALPRERLAHLTRAIHRLGERPLLELFLELEHGTELLPVLERYARLPADFIAALDGDRLPPVRSVKGRP
jgi:hypothetical protein